MCKIDFDRPVHIHFMGIGGISMSGLAEILLDKGFTVSGSDTGSSELTRHLESLGVKIAYGQRGENITDDIDVIVYTAAIREDNPEYIAAVASGKPMMDRAALLGQIMSLYKNSVAVAGTHGKTTTTSMLSNILLVSDMDPTITVGGMLSSIGGNIRVGHSDNFVAEACEYSNSFLKFQPHIEIILNIEEDHMDFFENLEDIRHSFRDFASKLGKDDLLVIGGEIEGCQEIFEGLPCRCVNFRIQREGEPATADYSAADISYDDFARGSFDLMKKQEKLGRIELKVIGEHNILNALAAASAASEMGVSFENIKKGLSSFTGTDRRFEHKGSFNGVTVVDDYAHHPTEITATLSAAKQYPHEKLWCVFQPHTYTRTSAFLPEFAEALSLADSVVLADIYAAREPDPGTVSSRDILKLLEEKGVPSWYFPSFEEIENFLKKNCINGDLLITMGAGNVVLIGEKLVE